MPTHEHYPRTLNDQQGGLSTDMSESLVCQFTTDLTNAQVLALRATPITVVAAPGAGKVIEFDSACLILNYGGTQYTESDDNLVFRLVNGSGSVLSTTVECTGFIDVAGDAISYARKITTDPLLTTAGELSNAVLVIHNSGNGEFGGGHASSTLRVIVNYKIHYTGL